MVKDRLATRPDDKTSSRALLCRERNEEEEGEGEKRVALNAKRAYGFDDVEDKEDKNVRRVK